jgi:hypothetical protein
MTEKKFAVVFDTNSYRQFANGKSLQEVLTATTQLRADEARKNIQSYGAVIVSLEMLSHLVENENDFNYKDCLNGILAMGNHCFDDNLDYPRIIPQPYLHITRSFFGAVPTEMEQRVKNIGGVVNDLRIDYEKAISFHKSKGTFEDIMGYLTNEEQKFSSEIMYPIDGAKQEILKQHPKIAPKDLRVKLLDFINKNFEPYHAIAIICAVSILLKKQLEWEEILKKAFAMNLEFPLSVGFYRWVSYKIVADTIDMQSKASKEKRWNWIWDYQVSFLMSENTLDNREVILVTSDRDVTEMLNDFGYNNKVLTISEYLDYLKQP